MLEWINSMMDWIVEHRLQLPCTLIGGSLIITIAYLVMRRFFPHWAFWASERCPTCGKFTLEDYKIRFNPPTPFTLGRCYSCEADYVKEEDRVIPRENHNGPGIVEFFFRPEETPKRDHQEVWDEIMDEREKSQCDAVDPDGEVK